MSTVTNYPKCPEALDKSQLTQYRKDGFIVFEAALTEYQVEEAKQALSSIIVDFVEQPQNWLTKKTTVTSKSSDLMFQLETGIDIKGKSAEELEHSLRKYMWFHDSHPVLKDIYTTNPRIQGVVKSILGSDTVLYQSMALVKPARVGIDKPWHQDNAYFSVQDPEAILGSWIALDDATVPNGCMHFIPGGQSAGPLKHHHTHDCEIVADRIDTSPAVPIEIPAGSIIFFSGNIPHYTPPNRSEKRRRALQYHYRSAANRIIPAIEYDTIFAESDGSPASCSAARRDGL